MTEEQIRIAQQLYGIIMILIRGAFLGLFLDLFLEKEILNRAKIIMISAVMTVIGLILFAIPFSTRGLYSLIGLIVIAIVFWLINPKVLPHSIFVFFLWNNVFYVWYLANFAIFNEITDKVTGAIDYSKEGAIERLWLWMFALIVAQIVFMALTLFGEYLVVRKLCQKKYDMSWTEALYLSTLAKKVHLIVRGDKIKCEKVLQDKLANNDKIETIYNSSVIDILGGEDALGKFVKGVLVKNSQTGEESKIAVDGVFIAIGHKPCTDLFKGQIDLDERGYIKTNPRTGATSVEGVFAAGDVQDDAHKQCVVAAGMGCIVALEIEKLLND